MKKITAFILAAVMGLLLVGCTSEEVPPAPTAGDTAEQGAQEAASDFVLKLDGETITRQQYQNELLYNRAYYDGGDISLWMTADADAALEMLKENIVNNLLITQAIKNIAAAEGIELTEQDIAAADAELATQAEQYGGLEEMEKLLAEQHLDISYFEDQVRLGYLTQKLNDHYFGADGVTEITPQALIDFSNESEYVAVKHVLVSEATLSTAVDANGEPYADLLAFATDISTRAKAGEDFDTLVTTYGEDPGMVNSPHGYYFTKGAMVPEFEESSFSLADNEVSEPIKTDYGYHIILKLPMNEETIANHTEQASQLYQSEYLMNLLEEEQGNIQVEYSPDYYSLNFESFVPDFFDAVTAPTETE